MEIDDNELTSLTWLHAINILPQRNNNVSSKRKNDKSKHHHTKKSSEKKHTSDIRTSPTILNSTNCTKNDNLSLQSAQMSPEPHTIISSELNALVFPRFMSILVDNNSKGLGEEDLKN